MHPAAGHPEIEPEGEAGCDGESRHDGHVDEELAGHDPESIKGLGVVCRETALQKDAGVVEDADHPCDDEENVEDLEPVECVAHVIANKCRSGVDSSPVEEKIADATDYRVGSCEDPYR